MKLHRIRCKNINSLYGDHEVDLESKLGGAGLFLIHGPTGAGKSTLMDVVSLALFGQTPRLSDQRRRLDTDPREVMSRGMGECLAEVEFSTLGVDGVRRRYRARWTCRRARKQPQGAFQDPERSLEVQKPDGSWVPQYSGAKVREAEEVFSQALEGFSAVDFQRSMLLAQGQFDALLSADAKERANILERLTRTERYKEIGARAAQIASAWREHIEGLEQAVSILNIVDENQYRARKQEEADLAMAMTAAQRDLEALETSVRWLEKRDQFLKDLLQARQAMEDVAREREERAPDLARLARYEECLPALEKLDSLKDLQGKKDGFHREIEELEAALGPLQQQLVQAQERQNGAELQHRQARSDLERLQEVAGRERESRTNHQNAAREHRLAEEQTTRAEREVRDLQEQAGNAEDLYREAEKDLTGAQGSLETVVQAIGDFLGDRLPRPEERTPESLREALQIGQQEVTQRIRLLEEAERCIQQADANAQALEEATRERDQASQALEMARITARTWEERAQALLQEARSLREAHDRAQRIAVLAQHRSVLVPGEPCPLCGSTMHPWVEDPTWAQRTAAIQEQLRQSAQALQEAEDRAEEAAREAGMAREERSRAQARLQGATERLEQTREALLQSERQKAQALQVAEMPQDSREGDCREAISRLESWLRQAQARKTDWDQAEWKVHQAEHRAEVARVQWQGNLQALEKGRADLERCREEALRRQKHLEETQRLWEQDRETLIQVWNRLETPAELQERRPGANASGEDFLAFQGMVARKAQEAWEAAMHRVSECQKEREGTTARQAQRRRDLTDLEILLKREQEALQQEVQRLGIDDWTELETVRLHRETWETLRRTRQDLENRERENRVRLEEKKNRLQCHLAERPEGLPETITGEELTRLMEAARERRDATKEVWEGAHREVLRMEEQRRQAASVRQRLARAHEQAAVWLRLHDLIGKKEGETFREFAQALNLDRLIRKANAHLALLEPRYRLSQRQDEGMPTLEFLVVDLYQVSPERAARGLPGWERNPRTLSGGERFLVSLALALGLSDLRSSRLPIETLLLDEGFGTLDPETLDAALKVLGNLQQNGRQVGIISHVTALKEHIPARITVQPLGGGRSQLVVTSS